MLQTPDSRLLGDSRESFSGCRYPYYFSATPRRRRSPSLSLSLSLSLLRPKFFYAREKTRQYFNRKINIATPPAFSLGQFASRSVLPFDTILFLLLRIRDSGDPLLLCSKGKLK